MSENKRFFYMAGIIFDNTKDKREWGIPINDLDKGLRIVDLLNEQDKKIKELDKYCTACDDTLLTIQELTYKLLTVDFKDTETKIDYCHLLNELDNKDLSFIHDCIKSINKCDLLEMEKLKREYGDVE